MREILITENSEIDNILEYLLETSGKMLRPRLVYMTASLNSYKPDVVRDIAVAVELIHMASLVHDDVIDNSAMRRGQPSINSHWGNQVSVLTGDYLFAAAFNLINKHSLPEVTDNLSYTIQVMCSGEIRQLSMLYNINITEEEYYDKTYRKTACLFASSCKVGAIASNLPVEQINLLERYGLCLGYAYQIIDDVLDFVSDSNKLGKPAGSDLLQGNITLPVILALNNKEHDIKLRNLLQNGDITSDKVSRILEILKWTGALEESIKCSRMFLQFALDLLDKLPLSPGLKELKQLSLYLVEGYYNQLKIYSEDGRRSQSGNSY